MKISARKTTFSCLDFKITGSSVGWVVTQRALLFLSSWQDRRSITTGPLTSWCCKMGSWCQVSIYMIFVHFPHCYGLSNKFLAIWNKIKYQYSEGQDWDGAIENIILATLPRSTTMFVWEGRRPSFLWGLSECWYALRVWLMPYLRLFPAITRLFLSSFGLQHFPPADQGSIGHH